MTHDPILAHQAETIAQSTHVMPEVVVTASEPVAVAEAVEADSHDEHRKRRPPGRPLGRADRVAEPVNLE